MPTPAEHHEHDAEAKRELLDTLEEFGYAILHVPASSYNPGFAYTVGLKHTFDHPEIILIGLDPENTEEILSGVVEAVASGLGMIAGKPLNGFLEGHPVIFEEVPHARALSCMGYAHWFYKGKPWDTLQFIWPDMQGAFAWEEGYEEDFRYQQPLLSRNPDFWYNEPKDLAVVTLRQYLEEEKPILEVHHDEEGDWQFLTGDELKEEDLRWVSLHTMVQRDATLNDIFDLEYGECALRQSREHPWVRYTKNAEGE